MDAAECETNTLLFSNIASIAFRTYTLPADLSIVAAKAVLSLEQELRAQKYVASCDWKGGRLWVFKLWAKDDEPEDALDLGLQASLPIVGQSLDVIEEGVFDPLSLQRVRQGQQQQSQSQQTPAGAVFNSSQDPSQKPAVAANPQASAAVSQGYISAADDGKSPKSHSKVVYKFLVYAILGAIIPRFCLETGALPLNYCTILLQSSRDGRQLKEEILVIGTFRIYLTTSGELVVSFFLSECPGLASLKQTLLRSPFLSLAGSAIHAAPFGAIGTALGGSDASSASAAQTPNAYSHGFRAVSRRPESLWKKTCLRILEHVGIAPDQVAESPWLNLSISKQPSLELEHGASPPLSPTLIIPWPIALCFRKKTVQVRVQARVEEDTINGHDEHHDPLEEAGNWFASLGQREQKIAKRKADRNSASGKDVAHEARTQVPLANNLRRPSAAASAGNMYPTPPDALQNPNGVTPSGDISLSSPNNVPSLTANAGTDNVQEQTEMSDDVMVDNYDFAEPKRELSGSNALGDADTDTDMFGDMGGDMFVDNDVTDADFSFFDEDLEGNEIAPSSSVLTPGTSTLLPEQLPPSQTRSSQAKPPKSNIQNDPPKLIKTDESPVFAKPELRHARSSQADYANSKNPESQSAPVKRESSPFDPQSVYKRVRASMMNERRTLDGRNRQMPAKEKSFQRVDFDSAMPLISKKYQKGGQFDFSGKTKLGKADMGTNQIPVTDYLRRHSMSQSSTKRPIAVEISGLASGLTKLDAQLSEDGGTSTESDQDEADDVVDFPCSPVKSDFRRPLGEDDAVSQATSFRDTDLALEPDQQIAYELPQLAQPEQVEVPLDRQYADCDPLCQDIQQSDEQYIHVAQILAEQAATGRIEISGGEGSPGKDVARVGRHNTASKARLVLPILREVATHLFGAASVPHAKELLGVQDALIPGQPARLQPRPVAGRENQELLRPNCIYQIPGPHLEVRRAETKLSVLPSAVEFWESLGLSPSSRGKDVRAACVFPRWTGVTDNAWAFLNRMKSVYGSLKLGNFETMGSPDDLLQEDNSLFPYVVDRIPISPSATFTQHGASFLDAMDALKWRLAEEDPIDVNIVVFVVYPPDQPSTIVEACTAFQHLFDSYRQSLGHKKPPGELVMQLVSEDMISSSDSLVVTPLPDLSALCFEVYDRCTLFEGQMPAPAIKLEQTLPRIIDFKVTSTPSASLMHENSCIHVSYAQSVDARWITAAWTDDRGNQQATAAYSLARHSGTPTNTVEEVAAEMWKSTRELISLFKVHWRVVVTKCSPMPQHEIDCWIKLAKEETKAVIVLVLMTVDTNPSLQLIPPCVKLTPSTASFYTTPVSTPQTNIVSPEQTVNTPMTPMRDSTAMAAQTPTDPTGTEPENVDISLIDVTDQTWGAVLGHRLSNTTSILEVIPALASGYLIKRTGTTVGDPPVLMEVNLVHAEATPRAFEALFREMLSQFRALGTLARARGVTDQEVDVRPWHVAAAEKANRALYLLM